MYVMFSWQEHCSCHSSIKFISSHHCVISSICLTPKTDNSCIQCCKGIRFFFFTESAWQIYCTMLYCFVYFRVLFTTIWNSRISVTFSLVSFGVVADDLVTRTVECAGSGTVFIYIAGTRDLDVEKQAHGGENSHYVCQQCHFHQKLREIGKIVPFYPCQNNILGDFSQSGAWVVYHGHYKITKKSTIFLCSIFFDKLILTVIRVFGFKKFWEYSLIRLPLYVQKCSGIKVAECSCWYLCFIYIFL